MHRPFARFIFLALIAGGLAVAIPASKPAQAADYNNSHLMDDQVFDKVGSMGGLTQDGNGNSVAEANIQAFLASKGPCLVNYRDVEPKWNGSAWTYTGSVPAARIIADVTRQWGINPQVLIATLQKEESLITGTSCDAWRYNSAMGYGCPDSGGCNPKYAGFTRQVLWAGWQLKFNKERAYGNTGWDGDGDITYGGLMTQGARKRCDSCQTFNYDGNATIDGQVIHLDNGTTASMYTYTPHLGQAFPGIFESWFGSVISPQYVAQYMGQSGYPTLLPGNTAAGMLKYRNDGNQVWYDDTSIGGAPAGSYAVHLATGHPTNRASAFGATWAAGHNRPALTFAAVYENDGVTLAANQHAVQFGQIMQFNFTFTVDPNQAPGVYREFLWPVAEGTGNGAFNDPGTFIDVTVQPKTYTAQFMGQSASPTVIPGNTAPGSFSYKNVGNQVWYDDTSIGGAPAGSYPVHLATGLPNNRVSPFGATWAAGHNRPALTFGAVYEADGTTLAGNQHVANPGQIAKFNFTFTVTPSQAGGGYREFFQPVAEGTGDGAFPFVGTYLDVTVQPATFIAQYTGQSNYPTIAAGSTGTGYFTYKNTGNQIWYDDSSVGSAPAGTYPIHLATGMPNNRVSPFGATWAAGHNRPDLTFTAVYEADGTTLAGNQHVANPGQIVKMGFTFTVSASQAHGVYREFFQPVAEGTGNGAFPFVGTYLDVTVQ